ncbi:MAG: ABC transporter permease [Thermoanaerobaculia bacterium]
MSALARLARPFRRETALSLAIVATIATSVGVATGLFGYFDSFLHPRLAAPEADRVVSLRLTSEGEIESRLSSLELEGLLDSRAFELLAGHSPFNTTVAAPAGSVFAWGQLVSGDFFALYGGRPELGRWLGPEDDRAGAESVAVLSHRLWRTAFAADPAVLGRSIRVNHELLTVVGVAPRDFEGVGYASEIFVPARLDDRLTGLKRSANPEERWIIVHARVGPGTGGIERSRAAAEAALAALDRTSPREGAHARRPLVLPATGEDPETRADPFFRASRLLAAAGILFVLLGSANLAGLLLARTAARDREWAVRKALGSSTGRLARQIVGGLLPTAVAGLALALVFAKLLEGWIEGMLVSPVAALGPLWATEAAQVFDLDSRGLVFAVATTTLALVAAALPPLVRVLRRDPNRTLRATSAGGGEEAAVIAPRRLLVALQLALAVTLLAGSGLLVRTLAAAASAPLGFDAHGLAFATVNLPRTEGGALADFATYLGLVERARATPGVAGATLALVPPLSPSTRWIEVSRVETPEERSTVDFDIVGPDFFSTLGVPILAGRALDARDAPGAAPAVVATRALVDRLWGDRPAVGRTLRVGGPRRPDDAGPDFEVVGVAADAAFAEPTRPRTETLFFAYGQRLHPRMTLVSRSATPLAALEPALRDAVAATRPDASLIDLVDAPTQLSRTLQAYRLNATVAGGLAVAGFLTALLGVFALQLYAIELRRRELAVRLALGARPADLARQVIAEGARLAAVGLAVGALAAIGTAKLLASLLFGVAPFDPWTFALVPVLLVVAVLLASWLPAWRAGRVDPMTILRAG